MGYLSGNSEEVNINCYGEDCAWFDKEEDECAVLTIAKKLNRKV